MTRKSDEAAATDGVPTDETANADAERKWTQTSQRHHDPEGKSERTTVIVYALAEAGGVAPTELGSPPLYESIDAAALEDTLFGTDGDAHARRGAGTVEFRDGDYLVTVRSDGWVQVHEPTEPGRRERH